MPTIEVAAGLIFRDGRVLIAQRPAGGHLAGLWEFPGGKREPTESFEQCLVRELSEELGIEVRVREEFEAVEHVYAERTVRLRFFRCEWVRHEPQALGCAAFRWIRVDELAHHQFPPADERLLKRLRERPDLWS